MTTPFIAPDTFVTYARGLDLPALSGIYSGLGLPARTEGAADGWVWLAHDAATHTGGDLATQAGYLTGFRYEERFGSPNPLETVFLASTPACACPHGQNYMVPHCEVHPFHFIHSRRGFPTTYFNMGARREARRHGDLLVRELLAAGIVGRETPRYESEPGFNADGAVTLRIITDHFGLPATGGGAGSAV